MDEVTAHNLSDSYAAGEVGESRLDEYFARWYKITPATPTAQREGIDRYFARLDKPDRIFTVEYKTDYRAGETGNAFIETVSVDGKKKGWAYTSRADMLLYRVVHPEAVYIIMMSRLRAALPVWEQAYRSTIAQNETYRSYGLLVPLNDFRLVAQAVYYPGERGR